MTETSAGKRFGIVDAAQQRAMSGLEYVQGLVNGTLPLNTMAQTLGYDIVEVSKGRAVVSRRSPMPGISTLPAPFTAALRQRSLDSCMGLAVRSMLDKGFAQTTLEFKISLRSPDHSADWPREGRRHGHYLWAPCRHG